MAETDVTAARLESALRTGRTMAKALACAGDRVVGGLLGFTG